VKQKYRLTRSIDFKRVRRLGRSYAHPLAVIVIGDGEAENPRIGIVATRSIGSAVHRNRVKRRLREIATQILPELQESKDLVIIAREPARNASFLEIRSAVFELLERAKIIVSNDYGTGRSTYSH